MKIRQFVLPLALAATTFSAHAQFPFPGMQQQPAGQMRAMGGFGGAGQGMQMQTQQMMMGIMSALNLNQEQVQQVAAISEEARAQNTALLAKIGEEFKQIAPLFASDSPDPAVIGAAYAKVFDLQRQAIEASVATYNKQVALLNEEQKAKWKGMRDQMLQRVMPHALGGMQ